jgi:hypothetical protein
MFEVVLQLVGECNLRSFSMKCMLELDTTTSGPTTFAALVRSPLCSPFFFESSRVHLTLDFSDKTPVVQEEPSSSSSSALQVSFGKLRSKFIRGSWLLPANIFLLSARRAAQQDASWSDFVAAVTLQMVQAMIETWLDVKEGANLFL